jgi:predicted nucleic-acid-binding Zn-ribbon protein
MTNDDFPERDEPFEAGPPDDDPVEEPYELSKREREDIEADLVDLESMRGVFQTQSVKGVVIACQDCGQNHFYEWELLRDNLEQMLATGEPRMHEPAWNIDETEYIQWDYGKGYVDALADTGLELEKQIEITRCPWCETPFDVATRFCPRCGRALAVVRLYTELLARGIDEREARALLVRAGFDPF